MFRHFLIFFIGIYYIVLPRETYIQLKLKLLIPVFQKRPEEIFTVVIF